MKLAILRSDYISTEIYVLFNHWPEAVVNLKRHVCQTKDTDQKDFEKLNRYYQKAENVIDKLDTAFKIEKFDEMYLEVGTFITAFYYDW